MIVFDFISFLIGSCAFDVCSNTSWTGSCFNGSEFTVSWIGSCFIGSEFTVSWAGSCFNGLDFTTSLIDSVFCGSVLGSIIIGFFKSTELTLFWDFSFTTGIFVDSIFTLSAAIILKNNIKKNAILLNIIFHLFEKSTVLNIVL